MKNLKFILVNVLVLVAVLSATEFTIAFLLNNPSALPGSWVKDFRNYYMSKDRQIVQYSPELATYDSELFYKLKPGRHSFNNREFSTKFTVSSKGFRDDEVSFDHPKIIVLGDSWTMGWGVNDEECYPFLIEQNTGLITLNTGVSSYGTVRELRVFSKLNTDSLKYLVIQFDLNDNNENWDYGYQGNKYVPSSEEEYYRIRDMHTEAVAYFPLKHTSHFLRNYLESVFPEMFVKEAVEEPAVEEEQRPYISPTDAFLNVLTRSEIPDSVPIIVFQVGDGSTEDLIDPLRNLLSENDSVISNPTYVLDMQTYLTEEHYYLLDMHLKPEGQRIVGNVLSQFILKLEEQQ